MKKSAENKKSVFVALCLVCLTFSACHFSNRIIVQDDIVYSTKRVELKTYHKDRDRRSPLIYLEQSFVKKIKNKDDAVLELYDELALKNLSFQLEQKAFMIVDDKVFPLSIETAEYENIKSVRGNTENILTSDSTNVSVVTGYSESYKKVTRFSYILSDDLINEIKKSNQVKMRYYAGPDMITVLMKNRNLKKLKDLINKA